MNKLLIVVLLIYLLTTCYCLTLVFLEKITEERLCDGYIDILMQSDCFLVIIVFVVMGAFITKRITEQQAKQATN